MELANLNFTLLTNLIIVALITFIHRLSESSALTAFVTPGVLGFDIHSNDCGMQTVVMQGLCMIGIYTRETKFKIAFGAKRDFARVDELATTITKSKTMINVLRIVVFGPLVRWMFDIMVACNAEVKIFTCMAVKRGC